MSEFNDALTIVKKHLKEDKDIFHTYKSNLAMAFYDQYYKNKDKEESYKTRDDIHMIANVAASNFLDLLIRE